MKTPNQEKGKCAKVRNRPLYKYQDDESDLLYYGYRYYKPSTGTWPNRDPIQEWGGLNLFTFVWNSPLVFVDAIGLEGFDSTTSEMRTLMLIGTTVKGQKVGTFQYPRKGQCGCWEKNIYADFTPKYTLPYTHYTETFVVREEHDLQWQIDAFLLSLGVTVATEGAAALEGLSVVNEGVLHAMGDHTPGSNESYIEDTFRKEWNGATLEDAAKPERVTWLMSETYKKKGESWKISDNTCRASLKLYNQNAIKALTDTLTPSIPGWSDAINQIFNVSTELVSSRVVWE